jgi:hypothetical protein
MHLINNKVLTGIVYTVNTLDRFLLVKRGDLYHPLFIQEIGIVLDICVYKYIIYLCIDVVFSFGEVSSYWRKFD